MLGVNLTYSYICRSNHSISAALNALERKHNYKQQGSKPALSHFPNNTPPQVGWYPLSCFLFSSLDLLGISNSVQQEFEFSKYVCGPKLGSGVGAYHVFRKDAIIRLPFSQKTQCPLENHKTSGVALPWKSSLKFTILQMQRLLSCHLVFNLFGMIICSSPSHCSPL